MVALSLNIRRFYMKKTLVLTVAAAFILVSTSVIYAVNNSPATAQSKAGSAAAKTAVEQKSADAKKPMRSNFVMMLGSISKIDTSNPSAIKVEVKDDRDGQMHIVEVTPSTNITKVTNVSELKTGDAVRVMARKVDDKEVAMGIMFGNFKTTPPPAKVPAAQAKSTVPAQKEMPKK